MISAIESYSLVSHSSMSWVLKIVLPFLQSPRYNTVGFRGLNIANSILGCLPLHRGIGCKAICKVFISFIVSHLLYLIKTLSCRERVSRMRYLLSDYFPSATWGYSYFLCIEINSDRIVADHQLDVHLNDAILNLNHNLSVV